MSVAASELPAGTLLRPLEAREDERGAFTELFRAEWATGVAPVQWNAVRSRIRGNYGPRPVK